MENQNLEWKTSWHDDYLKWICGFANAEGGTLEIGRTDDGKWVGVDQVEILQDRLASKIRDQLGIVTKITVHVENGLKGIRISVMPYSVPISLRGRYYYRTGSSNMELVENQLTDFLLKKTGISWDDGIEAAATTEDICEDSIRHFLADAKLSGRMAVDEELTTLELLEKLRLARKGQLKRAAIVLFGNDPNYFYPNLKVKIGRFGDSGDDLIFQEIEEGNLIQLLHRVPDTLNRKFLVKAIDYSGLQRVERGEYPVAALREMLLNALVHRSYSGSPVLLRVFTDKISIWNEGGLPEGLDLPALHKTHSSIPRNPTIADVCFKGGYIDSWGRGTLKIINACREAELLPPKIFLEHGGVSVTLFKDRNVESFLRELGLNDRQLKALAYLKRSETISNREYQKLFGVSRITALRDLTKLVETGYISAGDLKGGATSYSLMSGE